MNVGRYELRRSVLREEILGGRLCTSMADALWDDSQRRSQQVERPVAVEVAKFCCCSVRVRLIVCLEAVVWLLLPLRLWVKLALHALQMLWGGSGRAKSGSKDTAVPNTVHYVQQPVYANICEAQSLFISTSGNFSASPAVNAGLTQVSNATIVHVLPSQSIAIHTVSRKYFHK